MVHVRDAGIEDVEAIRDVFLACYEHDYPYQEFYDTHHLTKLVFSDDALMLVAEHEGKVVGTASVILEVGAYSDLVGEFGRLGVLPEARNLGLGKRLMQERLWRVRDRLHVGLIDGRVAHPFTQRIAEGHGFAVVGFAPLKMLLARRESLALLVQYFGDALALRRNHPRIIPEVYPIAHLATQHLGIPLDAIVDESEPAYPQGSDFDLQELTTSGYASLLRIERGRTRRREILGPTRLHYGYFKVRARKSRYLIARQRGGILGAVGLTIDPMEKVVRIFELISLNDEVIRFLLAAVERLCRTEWGTYFIEVDVSAHAPRMQRTLLELGFLPYGFVPALNFDEVERIDVVKMARLLGPLELDPFQLDERCQAMADVVLRGFQQRCIVPRVAEVVQQVPLFEGLNEEQVLRLAGCCSVRQFQTGDSVFARGDEGLEMHVVLAGSARVQAGESGKAVGSVGPGECLGEIAILNGTRHSATVVCQDPVETAVLTARDLHELVRQRPDIGIVLYRNVAIGLGQKLWRTGLARAEDQSSTDDLRDLA
ncbi:MAG TPA: GNAT family N-acetyltransferase [Gemmatales bacterium]|nr:GNAT family N-acetyltransferase [Gemmatales bacterium]HMP58004.1 GNAT family N-acetyltransferase [Gemmatales bacterium]